MNLERFSQEILTSLTQARNYRLNSEKLSSDDIYHRQMYWTEKDFDKIADLLDFPESQVAEAYLKAITDPVEAREELINYCNDGIITPTEALIILLSPHNSETFFT